MEDNNLILQLIDEKTTNILKILINNPDKDFNLRELAMDFSELTGPLLTYSSLRPEEPATTNSLDFRSIRNSIKL